jgi:hypothetical protein
VNEDVVTRAVVHQSEGWEKKIWLTPPARRPLFDSGASLRPEFPEPASEHGMQSRAGKHAASHSRTQPLHCLLAASMVPSRCY